MIQLRHKVFTFKDSESMEEWLDKTLFWKLEGVWGTPAGVHVLVSYEKDKGLQNDTSY